ncbi:MAG: right-handed parallel beta-helix repeat-containing protein [Armatimonadetes bacterium]|nr:right-handed parallel beta-helix repeat-containing protein [Armatimonadota bacterium]
MFTFSGSAFAGLTLIITILLSLVAACGHATDVVVERASGETDAAAIARALEKCSSVDSPRLVFPKGIYHIRSSDRARTASVATAYGPGVENPEAGPTVHLPFVAKGIRNLTIEGNGSELRFEGLNSCFYFADCSGITVKNLCIDWERPPFSVGEVIAVGDRTFDVRFGPDYPVKGGEPVQAFMDWDPQTKTYVRHGLDVYLADKKAELISPQVLRVFTSDPVSIKVGHYAVLRHQVYGYNAFVFDHCAEVLAQNINVYACPGMGLVSNLSANVTLDNFNVLPRPGSGRLMSATADATHFAGGKGFVHIQNCTFDGMGDDAVNIKSGLYLSVEQIVDDHTVLAQHNLKFPAPPDPGSVIEISRRDVLIPYTTRVVRASSLEEGGMHRISFEAKLPASLKPGDVLANSSIAPSVHIKNVNVRNNRARGFLIQTRNALIEDCQFKDVTSGGVWVMTETVYFFEAIGTRDITVRRCAFDNCNYGGPLGEGVLSCYALTKDFHYPQQAGVHQNILFEDNLIRGCDNSGIFVTSTDRITLRGNRVEQACRMPTRVSGHSAIYIESSKHVTLENNRVPEKSQGAEYEKDVEMVRSELTP